MRQEMIGFWDGSGISWTICKQSAPRSNTHHSVFLQAGCSSWCPTNSFKALKAHTYTHTRLTALCPGLPGWAGTRKVKPIWILLKQETVSGSGISWAICKSAPCSRQIAMPAPHHSVFLQAGCPSCRPTNSVKALKAKLWTYYCENLQGFFQEIYMCMCVYGGVWIVMQAMALWWWVRLLEKVIQAVISEHVFGEVNSLEEQSKCFERGKACSQLFKFFSSIISRCVAIAVVKARSCDKANGETTRRRQGSKPSGSRPKIVLDILETFIFYVSTWTVRVVWKYGHAYIYFHTCRCCGASASSVATTTTSRETFDEWCHPDARFSVAKF